MVEQRIGREYVAVQPQDHEIMAALLLYVGERFPSDPEEFARGIIAAVGEAPFLQNFIDPQTNELTDTAKKSLDTLINNSTLLTDASDGVLRLNPVKKQSLNSQTRTYFKDEGIKALQEAAVAARRAWFP